MYRSDNVIFFSTRVVYRSIAILHCFMTGYILAVYYKLLGQPCRSRGCVWHHVAYTWYVHTHLYMHTIYRYIYRVWMHYKGHTIETCGVLCSKVMATFANHLSLFRFLMNSQWQQCMASFNQSIVYGKIECLIKMYTQWLHAKSFTQ